MTLKKTALLLAFAVAAWGGARAQDLIVGADFSTRFDNREYAPNQFGEPQTLYSARLPPRIGGRFWFVRKQLPSGPPIWLIQWPGQTQLR